MENIKIIGTSHIAKESLQEVEREIERWEPDIVAIELDRKRFFALKSDQKRKVGLGDIRRIGVKGFLFNVIGSYVEKKLGKIVGVKPGSEMITAINIAHERKIKIALIDQDIEVTLRRFSKTFSWKEKMHLVRDLFNSVFFRKREMKKLGITDLDLSKVPSKRIIKNMINKVKVDYPNVYKVLIEERNHVMARNLIKLGVKNPDKKILVVVGAGHKEEIERIIDSKEDGITYSFSFG